MSKRFQYRAKLFANVEGQKLHGGKNNLVYCKSIVQIKSIASTNVHGKYVTLKMGKVLNVNYCMFFYSFIKKKITTSFDNVDIFQ